MEYARFANRPTQTPGRQERNAVMSQAYELKSLDREMLSFRLLGYTTLAKYRVDALKS